MTKKLCNAYKSFEANIMDGSWMETKESTQGNRVQLRSLAKAVRRYKHRTENKSK